METTVRDVMTTTVVAVRREATFKEMAATLRRFRVSAFPVVDDYEKVIGVVSEADLLTKEALDSEPEGMPGMITGMLRRKEQEKARGITADDLMTSPPVIVHPEDAVEHAARLMHARRVKRLPVVDAAGHLVGIISRGRAVRLRPLGQGHPSRDHQRGDAGRARCRPEGLQGDGQGRRRDPGRHAGHHRSRP